MSSRGKKLINPSPNDFVDRKINEVVEFPELTIRLERIESILLLLNSEEEVILVNVLKHLTEYVRKGDDNVELLKQHKVLDLLSGKGFYRDSDNAIIRRFSLYLANHILENMNRLVDLDQEQTWKLVKAVQLQYRCEEDDLCLEYLLVILCNFSDDPRMSETISQDTECLDKLLHQLSISNNPDVILNSMKLVERILRVLDANGIQNVFVQRQFPIQRIICHLASDFVDIRRTTLNLLAILLGNANSESGSLFSDSLQISLLRELTEMFCANREISETQHVVDVLSSAMRNKAMVDVFFLHNLFEQFMSVLALDDFYFEHSCQPLKVLCEIAKFSQYETALAESGILYKLKDCLVDERSMPSVHILKGLHRLITHRRAACQILELERYSTEQSRAVTTILGILINVDVNIEMREEALNLLLKLLKFAFVETSDQLHRTRVMETLAMIFAQNSIQLSTDLLLNLLKLVEILAKDTSQSFCPLESSDLIRNIAVLLTNSFSSAILVSSIFRCLATIASEEYDPQIFLNCHIGSSIKRGLKSLSNTVKTAACNFIMQTCQFREFLCEYIDHGILEILVRQPENAFCVPNWNTAKESILSKTPTLKFCIANYLGFTDSTEGHDFYVSKKAFDDFRIFQTILKEEVSPLQPILVVNFQREIAPQQSVIRIPMNCLTPEECQGQNNPDEWCYCRTPGNAKLPQILTQLFGRLQECELNPRLSCGMHLSELDFFGLTTKIKIISEIVAQALSNNLPSLDLNGPEECSQHLVECHLKELAKELHCNFIPLGQIKTGCQFERSVLFKALADQIGLPCTLCRSVDGRTLYNEISMPIEVQPDIHCDVNTLTWTPLRMLRPTHVVDLMYNIGEIYPLQSGQAMKYLRLD